jgi:hypothetical protein
MFWRQAVGEPNEIEKMTEQELRQYIEGSRD